VSVEFARGSFTAIMGSSGSGKSTLMHILAGLAGPTTGWVEIDGKRLDGTLVVVAANGGSRREPQWYRNLLASPEAFVQRGSETLAVHAHEATGNERDRLWTRLTAANRWLAGAETRAGRRFPVMVLEPR